MPAKRKSGPRGLAPSEVSHLARAHGITRDQARRLMNKIGNNRTKLDEAARILKARSNWRVVNGSSRSRPGNFRPWPQN